MLLCIKKGKGRKRSSNTTLQNVSIPNNETMITLFYENDNIFNQDTYDNIIDQVDFMNVRCPHCKHSGCLIKHGRYKRTFRLPDSTITISILRVLCKECGHTHAVLLCEFVPYSQILLDDQVSIIRSDDENTYISDNPNFEKSDYRYVRKQFSLYWKQRLISCSLSLDENPVYRCFREFRKQFMQIKCTINALHHVTHIRFF